jgi:hypothetical protein
MPFDANLVLHDGTAVTADKTPTSTTRSGGSVCIDLGKGQAAIGSGLMGMAAVLIDPDGLTTAADDIDVSIQACPTVNGSYVTVATFQQIGGTVYDGSTASTQIVRFGIDPQHRYVRAYINITDAGGSDMSEVVYVFLTPYPYAKL